MEVGIQFVLGKFLEKFTLNLEVIAIVAVLLTFVLLLLKRKSYFFASLMFFGAVIVAAYYRVVIAWITGLGGDSFVEASNFDWQEGLFWAESFVAVISSAALELKLVAFVLLVASLASVLFFVLCRFQPRLVYVLLLLLVGGHVSLVYATVQQMIGAREYAKSLSGQFVQDVSGVSVQDSVDLLVYIGESTSTLNMGLYGYPLNTTPLLSQIAREDLGFIKLEQVRSRYTHTSDSLLDSLVVDVPNLKYRIGIGNLLRSAGVSATLFSVQPQVGSFAAFSKYAFDGMQYADRGRDKMLGNSAPVRAKDFSLLQQALHKDGVVFFHSYAGHGNYLDFIELDKSSFISLPNINFSGMFGQKYPELISNRFIDNVRNYDRAITYIDHNLAYAINNIKIRQNPAVLLYFSDHGESVYTRRGHESSLYIDEMTTVPFLLYFNQSYIDKYPEIYARYKDAEKSRDTKLLNQLIPTILELLRVSSSVKFGADPMSAQGTRQRASILERQTSQGRSEIVFANSPQDIAWPSFVAGTPEPTYVAIANQVYKDNTLCYHRSNSYAKALRAASVAKCLEVDLVVENGKLQIFHPPSEPTGFLLEHVFQIAQHRKNKIWIDGKNIDQLATCNDLSNFLESNTTRVGELFIEFPSGSVSKLNELSGCLNRIKALGARVSYYVPTHLSIPCAQQKDKKSCKELNEVILIVVESKLFTDLSFDISGYDAISPIEKAKDLSWSTWGVNIKNIADFDLNRFRYTILDTTYDPNAY